MSPFGKTIGAFSISLITHSNFLSCIPMFHICFINLLWLTLSKNPLISMSTTKCIWDFCINAYACAIACSADLFGRNPLLLSLNLASQIGSRICKIHCWTILSHIAGIPSGLNFPFGFGISTLLTALGLYHWSFFLTISTNFVSGIFSISLIVSLSIPLVLLPELQFYVSDKQGECFLRSQ